MKNREFRNVDFLGVHSNVKLFSVFVDIVSPHVVAEHDFFDHRDEVVGHSEANNRK